MPDAGAATPAMVIPARDAAPFLRQTLPRHAALGPGHDLIVVDDASLDDTARVAAAAGARLVRLANRRGPAAARNAGAAAVSPETEILVFMDADVCPHDGALVRLLAPFADPSIAATFGSYDDSPPERSWISLYKNLAHHFVHQRSREEAATFWAGFGAVRRDVFLALGGFDERYRAPSIEDVEMGYRLRAAGHRARLVKQAQVVHLKRWTLLAWLRSDLCQRAIPWARLLRAGRALPADLNFTPRDRLASALVALGLLGLPAAIWWLPVLAVSATVWLVAAALDIPFLRLCARRGPPGFPLAAAGLHLVHRALGIAGLVVGWLLPSPWE